MDKFLLSYKQFLLKSLFVSHISKRPLRNIVSKQHESFIKSVTSIKPVNRVFLEGNSSIKHLICKMLRSNKVLRSIDSQMRALSIAFTQNKTLININNEDMNHQIAFKGSQKNHSNDKEDEFKKKWQELKEYEEKIKQKLKDLEKNSAKNKDFENFEKEIKAKMKGLFEQAEKMDNTSKNKNDKGNQSNQNEPDEDEKRKKDQKDLRLQIIQTIAVFLAVWMLSNYTQRLEEKNNDSDKQLGSGSNSTITWNDFYYQLLLRGEVEKVIIQIIHPQQDEFVARVKVHEGAKIEGHTNTKNEYILKIPKDFAFEERVRRIEDALDMKQIDRISIEYQYPKYTQYMTILYYLIGMIGITYLFRRAFSGGGIMKDGLIDTMTMGMRNAKFTRGDIKSKDPGKRVTFKDVAGLKEAKTEVMEFVSYLTKPEVFRKLGAKTPRGALLLGPPGCGKTLLAKALATEAKVPFLAIAGSEFIEMIGGVGASRVRNLFKEAKQKAPCIIYIDEIDAVGKNRSSESMVRGGGESEQTLNQLLVEMDGMGTHEGVLVMAATNRADVLDKALLRAGRFDRHISIDLPTLQEREEIFQVYLNNLKLAQPPRVYSGPLARLTPGMSGADIKNICNEAAIHAARQTQTYVDKHDFEYAVERVIAGPKKKSQFLSPQEKRVVAYHECGHALVGWLLKNTDALLRVSIVPRTTSALGFAQYLPTDQKLYSSEELFERMCMALGGRAAESLIFNKVSTGAQDDLKRVTQMAYAQIRLYGMNSRIGHMAFPQDEGTKPFSNKLASTIDEEARGMVAQAFLHTQKVLEENQDKLHTLAASLLDKEVLEYHQVQDLIGPPPHGKKNTMEPEAWESILPRPQ